MIYTAISQRHRPGILAFLAAQNLDSPVYRFLMRETSGTTLVDAIAANNGTLSGTYTLNQTGPWSDAAKCIDFAAGMAETFGTTLPTGVSADFTVEALIYPETTSRVGIAGTRPSSAAQGWVFNINQNAANDLTFFATGGSGITVASAITQNVWQQVGAAYDDTGQNGYLYVNGSEVGNGSIGAITASTYNGCIANEKDNNTVNRFTGKMCFVTFYNARLSTAQMLAHAKAGGFA